MPANIRFFYSKDKAVTCTLGKLIRVNQTPILDPPLKSNRPKEIVGSTEMISEKRKKNRKTEL
jgi:hypothetical protein